MKAENYMGYDIMYDNNKYSVLFGGEYVYFEKIFDARNFVDRILEEKRDFFKKIMAYNNFLYGRE